MEAEYARAYRELYHRHWWWRAREDFLVSQLTRHLPRAGPARILDVGCGAGLFFDRLAPFGDVQGVETDTGMRTGDPEMDRRIHWGPLETMPPSRPFTCILMLDVLEHLDDPAGVLRQAKGRLTPDGILVATVPAFQLLWTEHDRINQHVRRYRRGSLRSQLEGAGFRAVTLRYFFHWTFPAKLIVRAGERVRPSRAGSAVPRVPPRPVNGALYHLTRLEQACFSGLPLPFGSSLLAVAVQADLAKPARTP